MSPDRKWRETLPVLTEGARRWHAKSEGPEPHQWFDFSPLFVCSASVHVTRFISSWSILTTNELYGAAIRSSGNTYWGVTDINAEWARLIELGAGPDNEIEDVGGDILAASVTDPWGNVIGLIQNPHFDPSEVR